MGNEWSMKPLEEVAHVVMGYSPKAETYNNEGKGAPLLNGPTEFGAHSPRATVFTTDPSRFSEPGDILFCVRGKGDATLYGLRGKGDATLYGLR